MPSFWCEYECVVLKDKVRRINIVRVFEHLSNQMRQCQTQSGQECSAIGSRGKCRNKEKKLFYFISFIIIL